MLGKLFNLGAGSGAGANASAQTSQHKAASSNLESVQEDIHTRNLLFPDPHDLYEHRLNQLYPLSAGPSVSAGLARTAFDYNADIDLDVRDVRVVIMQDSLSSVAASLMYDSRPPPVVAATSVDRPSATAGSYSVQEPRRNPASPRKPSVSQSQRPIIIHPESPRVRQGAFDRRPSVHSRGQACSESDSQRAWREYRDELATFSSCIFGNSDLMAYKGTSTKVHVMPTETRLIDSAATLGDGRGSLGRSGMRASRLSQSFSSENPPPFPTPSTPSPTIRGHDRKKVLVTRLFPVNLPIDEESTPPHGPFSEESAGYPFPPASDETTVKKKKPGPKQKRTPMYAVALVINLPPTPAQSAPATLRSGFRGPSSYTEQDSFPSSFNSARRSGWTLVNQGGYGFDSFETSFGGDIEDQIDVITQHWDIIMRTLNHLQSVVATRLFTMLRQTDLASPDPLPPSLSLLPARTSSVAGRRNDDGYPAKPPKTNAKLITLLPNSLNDNRHIAAEVEAAKARIVAGIRASRVTTGQNRWPIWREEARWIGQWAGGKEQNFLINLLTGFLATHTDWLQALSPASYRRRHLLQLKSRAEEDTLVPARTIITGTDKIAARRLIFLLSAFLPASQQLPGIRTHRPSTSASTGGLSQSPPSFVVPILKEESLRRKINRRAGSRMPSHSRNLSVQSQNARSSAVPPPLAHLSMESRHERRASDATSIRTSHLPIRGSDPMTRKSSAATTATVTPETSVPHFSTVPRPDVLVHGRPGSSNSIAADDLKRLAREESAGVGDARQASRWGSVIGFWNSRRRDSTAKPPEQDGNQPQAPSSPKKLRGAPSQATPPAETPETQPSKAPGNSQQTTSKPSDAPLTKDSKLQGGDSTETLNLTEQTGVPVKMQRTPDPSGAFESPVKTSINLDDGVIDVDVPLPDYLTSFESAVSSPSSSGYLSAAGFGTGLDAFEQYSRFSFDGDVPLNVAGWLQQYHPDFVLQALPTADDIKEQVKASMRAEPTPPVISSDGVTERWVDISSAIIADTTTFTVTRIRHRRFVRLRLGANHSPTSAAAYSGYSSPTLLTPANSAYEAQLKEEFTEEVIVGVDVALSEAVEKVMVAGTDVSKSSSSCSSRSTSKRRERSNSTSTHSDGRSHHGMVVSHEVPRSQCKTVLLSALEDIIREVVEDREREAEEERETHEDVAKDSRKANVLREAVAVWLETVDAGY